MRGPLGCIKDGKPYIAGFNSISMVAKVSRELKKPPIVHLDRSMVIDITEEVKNGLGSIGFKDNFMSFASITIDTEALFTIERAKGLEKENLDDDIIIDPIDPGDFMFMTFEKNVGLIMPYEQYLENDDYLVYKSNVIDPSNDPEQFKKGLKI